MRFGKRLYQSGVPEWRTKYVAYDKLKRQIKAIKRSLEKEGSVNVETTKNIQKFWAILDNSLQTVAEFYKEKIIESNHSLKLFTRQLLMIGAIDDDFQIEQKDKVAEQITKVSESLIFQKNDTVADRVETNESDSESELDDEYDEYLKGKSEDEKNVLLNKATTRPSLGIDADPQIFPIPKSVSAPTIKPEAILEQQEKIKKKLRSGISEFYLSLEMLKKYCMQNSEAFGKILKKYDKQLHTNTRAKYLKKVKLVNFYSFNELKDVYAKTENLYTKAFFPSDRKKAMNELRLSTDEKSGWMIFRIGLYLGITIVFIAIIILLALSDKVHGFFENVELFVVFRMIFLIFFIVFMWGFDIRVWQKYRINYTLIFGFDSRGNTSFRTIYEAVTIFCPLILFAIILCQLTTDPPEILDFVSKVSAESWTIIAVASSAALFVIQQWGAKFWLIRTVCRIITAPFHRIQFRDFYLGDQLVSLSIVIADIVFTILFIASDSWRGTTYALDGETYFRNICSGLPSFWRFLQCLRKAKDTKKKKELANALKYTGNMIVTTMSACRSFGTCFTYLWIVSAIASTTYNYYWDIVNDWGLMIRKTKHFLLREQLTFKPCYYYMVMAEDILLRLVWILSISPQTIGNSDSAHQIFLTVVAILEVFRRGVWNIFRLENQHINNCKEFRATKEIPMPIKSQVLDKWDQYGSAMV